MKVLVTGATGFLGRRLIEELSKSFELKALIRKLCEELPLNVEQIVAGDFCDLKLNHCDDLLNSTFNNVDIVVHTAARVHIMNDNVFNALSEFRKVNYEATLLLARMAAKCGVKRFIFLSSIKVNGETSKPGKPFTPDDVHIPSDPYALSKFEAEQDLLALAKETKMEVVIIRPPLVYGPGVKGNFYSIIKWVTIPIPLPFGAINNQRSLIALDNLVNFISLCVDRKKSSKASNQIFLVSDGKDISTTNLFKKLGRTFKYKARFRLTAWLMPVPVCILLFFGKIFRKRHIIDRLIRSLQVDNSKAQYLLGWRPVISMDAQLIKMKYSKTPPKQN